MTRRKRQRSRDSEGMKFEKAKDTKLKAAAMFKLRHCRNPNCDHTSRHHHIKDGLCNECRSNPVTVRRMEQRFNEARKLDAIQESKQKEAFGAFS